jgi:hypothetical protein
VAAVALAATSEPRDARCAQNRLGGVRTVVPRVNEVALQILDGLDDTKISRYADEMDPLNVVGEAAQLEHEQTIELEPHQLTPR